MGCLIEFQIARDDRPFRGSHSLANGIMICRVANGFECGYAANYDTYLEKYTAKYPYGAGPIPQDQASARMRAKLARIAKLEAELNELRGSL